MIELMWVLAGLAAAAVLGWPLTLLVLRLARVVDPPRPAAPAEADAVSIPAAVPPVPSRSPAVRPAPEAVLRGGLLIGFLERIAVATAILADEPVAIAYVVAIKGLGRYAELKETPAAAERFIIGTLTSMLWAVGVAVAVRIFALGGIT